MREVSEERNATSTAEGEMKRTNFLNAEILEEFLVGDDLSLAGLSVTIKALLFN